MILNHTAFFDSVRASLFNGNITTKQFTGMQAILARGMNSFTVPRRIAYMLATAYHETDKTMQPIAEYGKGKGKPYGKVDPKTGEAYYGRGLVQLTWADNYKRMGKILGLPLYESPALAMEMPIAVRIMYEGMERGLFTGKALDDYFNATTDDPVNARRIVNGTDKAQLIAGYHYKFLDAAVAVAKPVIAPLSYVVPMPQPTVLSLANSPAGPLAAIAALIAAIGAGLWMWWK